MAKKKETTETPAPEEQVTPAEETVEEATPEVNEWEEKYNAQYDSYLRLYEKASQVKLWEMK